MPADTSCAGCDAKVSVALVKNVAIIKYLNGLTGVNILACPEKMRVAGEWFSTL